MPGESHCRDWHSDNTRKEAGVDAIVASGFEAGGHLNRVVPRVEHLNERTNKAGQQSQRNGYSRRPRLHPDKYTRSSVGRGGKASQSSVGEEVSHSLRKNWRRGAVCSHAYHRVLAYRSPPDGEESHARFDDIVNCGYR